MAGTRKDVEGKLPPGECCRGMTLWNTKIREKQDDKHDWSGCNE